MKITKFGHCCLLIEINGFRILTDPGKWSSGFEELKNVDLILITHEHSDHLHVKAVENVLANNAAAEIITNSTVGKMLGEEGITHTILEGRGEAERGGVRIAAFDGPHAEIFEQFGLVQNTGYFIDDRLFYPGDAYTLPSKPVDVLALPVAGPWCQAADSLRYCLEVGPRKAFPVHDAVLNEAGLELVHGLFEMNLKEKGIDFVRLNNGDNREF